MYGICLLHMLHSGLFMRRGLDNLMSTCVVGFVFISGWFGIRFTWQKVFKLVVIGVYCAIVAGVFHMIVVSDSFSCDALAKICWWNLKCYWFLWAYIGLMLLAPLVEPLFATKSNIKVVLPALLMVFGWSYAATTVPVLKEYLPSANGFGPTTVLTLFGIYLAARWFAVSGWLDKLPWKWLAIIGLIGSAFSWIGFYHYHSPFALMVAVAGFGLFYRLRLPKWLGSVCVFLSPSLFSVYLLHTTGVGLELMKRMASWYSEVGCVAVAYALLVFSVCIMLDMPRRSVVEMYMRLRGRNA